MRVLFGIGLLAVVVVCFLVLLPRNGRERRLVALPGMWIVLGLALTTTSAGGIAMIATGLGYLR